MSLARSKSFVYGFAELGPASLDIFLKVYLLVYFNSVVGLPASVASLAIGLSVFWDAILDPFIGIWSDHYYAKHKNRKLIIYLAIVFMSSLFFMLWKFHFESKWLNFTSLFVISALLNSSISLFSVPYFSLANDLEPSNEQRKTWIGWRHVFFNLGSLFGLAIPAVFLAYDESFKKVQGYHRSVLVLTLVTLVTATFSIYWVYRATQNKKTESYTNKVSVSGLGSHRSVPFKQVIQDSYFMQILASFFIVNSGLGLNASLAMYYYKQYLGFSEKQTQSILLGFLFVLMLSVPIWIYLTRFFEKRTLLKFGGFSIGVLIIGFFPYLKGFDFWFIFFLASVIGGFLLGVAVILDIELADFLKDKEHVLQKSVSAQYLGIWKMSAKSSRAVAIGLAGPILDISASNTQLLARFFGWGVGIFFILSALVLTISVGKKDERKNRQ